MSGVLSHARLSLWVSPNTALIGLDQQGFEALPWVQVGNVGSVGEYGADTKTVEYVLMQSDMLSKVKGMSNGGDPVFEVARDDSDPGQIILRNLSLPGEGENYCARIVKQDGTVDYLLGLFSGPVSPLSRNEDFDIHKYSMALNQLPIHADEVVLPPEDNSILATGIWNDNGIHDDAAIWNDIP